MTIKQIIKSSPLDRHLIEFILQEELGLSSSQLFLNFEKKVSIFKTNRIKRIEKKVSAGYPVQYIYRNANFNGLDLFVDKNVLIPRPETEILVEKANSIIQKRNVKRIIDIGTGTGAIAISIAKNNPKLKVEAVDVSVKALRIARKNAKRHSVEIEFYKSNLLEKSRGKYDLILSNPPYLNQEDSAQLVAEPQLALYGGKKGMDLIESLILDLPKFLAEKGIAIFEIGHDQKNAVESACDSKGLKSSFVKDLNGYDRFAIIGKDTDQNLYS